MTNFELPRHVGHDLCEGFVNAALYVNPVYRNTRLARMSEFQRMYGIGGLDEVGIIEDEDGTVAAEFEGYLFQAVGADFGDELADACATGEGDFLDFGIAAQSLAEAGSIV